jgi:7-carboxy-7-deazaguanine synthase
MDIRSVDGRIRRVVDIKTPASGEVSKNRLENLVALKSHDQVKIVICSREDYEWVRALVHERLARLDCPVLLSPSWGQQDPRQLAEWILEDRLDVRLQLQMHKFLWGEEAGR